MQNWVLYICLISCQITSSVKFIKEMLRNHQVTRWKKCHITGNRSIFSNGRKSNSLCTNSHSYHLRNTTFWISLFFGRICNYRVKFAPCAFLGRWREQRNLCFSAKCRKENEDMASMVLSICRTVNKILFLKNAKWGQGNTIKYIGIGVGEYIYEMQIILNSHISNSSLIPPSYPLLFRSFFPIWLTVQ